MEMAAPDLALAKYSNNVNILLGNPIKKAARTLTSSPNP
jgi:hypothetical protein